MGESEKGQVEKQRTYSKSYRKINTTLGTYKPWSIIYIDEGGMVDPNGAMKAVNSIVAKCMRMQGPWIWRNPQTERLEFLHLQKSSNDIMEQSWNLYLEDASQTLPVENRAQTTPDEAPQGYSIARAAH